MLRRSPPRSPRLDRPRPAARPPPGQQRARLPAHRLVRGGARHGVGRAGLGLLRTGSGAHRDDPAGRGEPLLGGLGDHADRGVAGGALLLLPPDGGGLPVQRRGLHGGQGEPRARGEPPRRRRPDDRLRAQRGGGHIGGGGGADLRGAGAAALDPAPVPGRAAAGDARQPARHGGGGLAVRLADLHLHAELPRADRCGARRRAAATRTRWSRRLTSPAPPRRRTPGCCCAPSPPAAPP